MRNTERRTSIQPEPEITPIAIETGNLTFDDEISNGTTDVEFVREQFVLRESNLMKLDALLSKSNSRKLVEE